MSDDIVARLHRHRCVTGMRTVIDDAADEIEDLRFQLSGTQGELENALSRERTLLRDQEDCRIGADNLQAEIERLRRNTGCARDQRSTQFCAEAMDAQRELEKLRAELRTYTDGSNDEVQREAL
jgi:chromosome segregation ATPase